MLTRGKNTPYSLTKMLKNFFEKNFQKFEKSA